MLKRFFEEHALLTQISPLSKLLTNEPSDENFKPFNSHESPIAAKINKFDNEGAILYQLSQRGSTPERSFENVDDTFNSTSYNCSKQEIKNPYGKQPKHVIVSRISKPLSQSYKFSNDNSIGTRKLQRFIQKHFQKPRNKPLPKILNMPDKRNNPNIITHAYNNTLINFIDARTSTNLVDAKLERSMSDVDIKDVSKKSPDLSMMIRKTKNLLDYFKESKNIKRALQKNISSYDSDICCLGSCSSDKRSFESTSKIKNPVFDQDYGGCARTKAWPNIKSRLERSTADVNIQDSSEKFPDSSQMIRKNKNLFDYFKKSKHTKKSLEENNSSYDSDIACLGSCSSDKRSFESSSKIRNPVFDQDCGGCARTKALLNKKSRLERSTADVNIKGPLEKSPDSLKMIRENQDLLDFFKESKNIKQALEKNNFNYDSDIACSGSCSSDKTSFESTSRIRNPGFDQDCEGCARTKVWPHIKSLILREERRRKKQNTNTINMIDILSENKENKHKSSLFKGLDFIEEFDKEYGKGSDENHIFTSSSKSSCCSSSNVNRKDRFKKLDHWVRNPFHVTYNQSVKFQNKRPERKIRMAKVRRRASSETKARSKEILRHETTSQHKFTMNKPKQDGKLRNNDSREKNLITKYFTKNKLLDNKECSSRYSSDIEQEEKQLSRKENDIFTANKTNLQEEIHTNNENGLKNTKDKMDWNKNPLTNQNTWQRQTNTLEKLRKDSKDGSNCLKQQSRNEKKIQTNLYSSEGFYESMSLESPILKSRDTKPDLATNCTKNPSSLSKIEKFQNFGRRKKNPIRDSEEFKEISSLIKFICSQPEKSSPKPEQSKPTPSEERELSPDYYVMKMCGPESEILVKKILNSHKNADNESYLNKNDTNEQNNLDSSLDFCNNPKSDSENNLCNGKTKYETHITNKNNPSDPLSLGSQSLNFSGNVNQENKHLDSKIGSVGENQARNILKRNYHNSDEANYHQNQLSSPLSNSETKRNKPNRYVNSGRRSKLTANKKQNQNVYKNHQIIRKKKKLDSETLESLFKLQKSDSWLKAESATKNENVSCVCSFEKNSNAININQEITQDKELSHQLLATMNQEPVKASDPNCSHDVVKPHLTSQITFLSPEIVGTQTNSKVLCTQDSINNVPLFATEKYHSSNIRNDDSEVTNTINCISTQPGTIEAQCLSQNAFNHAFIQKLLSQHFATTLNKNYNTVNPEVTENNRIKQHISQSQDNCKPAMNSESNSERNHEELTYLSETQTQTQKFSESIVGTQTETEKSVKKFNKTYNITEDCILYKDNLMKSLIEDEDNIWNIPRKKKPLKTGSGGEVLKYGHVYIKRYKKGNTKIYKIKRRIKERKVKNYIPPESQIMNKFLKKVNNNFEDASSSDLTDNEDDESVSTPVSYKTDETKSEVLSTGSSKLTDAQKLLRQGINKLSKDKSLIFSKFEDAVPNNFSKNEILANIENVINSVLNDFKEGKNPIFKVPKEDISNCFFSDGRYQMKETPEYTTVSYKSKKSRQKFNLILFLLNKIKTLLETDTKLTKREIYYQLKTLINMQGTTDRALKEISRMLNVGLWALNITAQKGLVYGNLKLVMSDGESINCNVPGTLIPQDIAKICEVQSTAYFILVVEKESIFHKLLEENLPNRLTRPFILITGKGFPDLNTQLFLKKLWMIMSIPVFILVDADPHGIAIMLNYRFGSIANAHVSEHLAIPKARWLGVFPSEILRLSLSYENLNKREVSMTEKLLQLECVQENEMIKTQLETLLENGLKSGIEGLIKSDTYLSNCYLSMKFFTNNLI